MTAGSDVALQGLTRGSIFHLFPFVPYRSEGDLLYAEEEEWYSNDYDYVENPKIKSLSLTTNISPR